MRTTWEKKNLAEKEKGKENAWSGVEFFFWNFLRWYLLEGSHENPGRRGKCTLWKVSILPIVDGGQRGGTNSYDLYANRSASLFVPLIRSIADRIEGLLRLEKNEREREREERFGSRVVTEEIRRRRWGEVHPGRCISVITERDPIRGGRPPLFPSCNTFLTRVYALPPSFLCILFFLLPIQRYSLWSKLRFRDKREFWYDIS